MTNTSPTSRSSSRGFETPEDDQKVVGVDLEAVDVDQETTYVDHLEIGPEANEGGHEAVDDDQEAVSTTKFRISPVPWQPILSQKSELRFVDPIRRS